MDLYRHLSKTETPLREIINETLQEVHEDAIGLDDDHLDSFDSDLREILRSALQLSAESMFARPQFVAPPHPA